jgi:hypothetical protein
MEAARLRRLSVALAAALFALAAAPAAAADSASSGEVRALAARAADDPQALARLRRIDVVDGRRMPLRAALRGARRAELDRRLRVLAAGAGAFAAARPGGARADAHEILSQRKYRGSRVPRPFHGILVWIGERVTDVARALDRVVPGPPFVVWLILSGLVVVAASTISARAAKRRGGRHLEGVTAALHASEEDPRVLEREADEAERSGDVERALRLRFRAGLLRLARARAIPRRDSITTGEVRRILRSPHFDRLAATFDEVVYGRRAALRSDVEAARAEWPLVLDAARVR